MHLKEWFHDTSPKAKHPSDSDFDENFRDDPFRPKSDKNENENFEKNFWAPWGPTAFSGPRVTGRISIGHNLAPNWATKI